MSSYLSLNSINGCKLPSMLTSSRALSEGFVTVLVGQGRQPQDVYIKPLRDASPYFRKLLEDTNTSPRPRYELPDIDPDIFMEIVKYLYGGLCDDIFLASRIDYFRLWILAGELGMTILQNELIIIIPELLERQFASPLFGISQLVEYVYTNTKQCSPLRQILAEMCVCFWDNGQVMPQNVPCAFTFDVCNAFLTLAIAV